MLHDLKLRYYPAWVLSVNKTERDDSSGVFIRCLYGCDEDSWPKVILQGQVEADGHGAKRAHRPEFVMYGFHTSS